MIHLMRKLNLERGGDNMADFPRIKWLNIDGQQVPFTEPQHFTGNGDETVRTGHDNPLPVANYTQNESGLWLPTSKENPMPTQVTGSKVERIELLPATSLRDTSTFGGDYIDTDKYEKMLFFVNSTLDAEVYIAIRIAGSNIAIWKDGEWANTYPGEMGSLDVEEGRSGEVRILNTKYEWLNTLWSDRMQIRVRAKSAPTSGTVEVFAYGVI